MTRVTYLLCIWVHPNLRSCAHMKLTESFTEASTEMLVIHFTQTAKEGLLPVLIWLMHKLTS